MDLSEATIDASECSVGCDDKKAFFLNPSDPICHQWPTPRKTLTRYLPTEGVEYTPIGLYGYGFIIIGSKDSSEFMAWEMKMEIW